MNAIKMVHSLVIMHSSFT